MTKQFEMASTALQKMTLVHSEKMTDNTLMMLLKPFSSFAFHGGQYVMMGMDKEELKPFSIASACRDDDLIELHIRDTDHSEWMQNLFALETGAVLWVSVATNQYELASPKKLQDKTVILIAGGTGYAPMRALLDELLKRPNPPKVEFYWGAKTEEELYRDTDMKQLAEQHENVTYIPVLSGTQGVAERGVHRRVLTDHLDLTNVHIYLCGPWAMFEAAKKDFIAAGLTPEQFN